MKQSKKKWTSPGVSSGRLIQHWEMHHLQMVLELNAQEFPLPASMLLSWRQTHAACERLPWEDRLVQRIRKPHGWSQEPAFFSKHVCFSAAKNRDLWVHTFVIPFYHYPGNLLIMHRKREQFSGDDIPYFAVIARWLRGGYTLPLFQRQLHAVWNLSGWQFGNQTNTVSWLDA